MYADCIGGGGGVVEAYQEFAGGGGGSGEDWGSIAGQLLGSRRGSLCEAKRLGGELVKGLHLHLFFLFFCTMFWIFFCVCWVEGSPRPPESNMAAHAILFNAVAHPAHTPKKVFDFSIKRAF